MPFLMHLRPSNLTIAALLPIVAAPAYLPVLWRTASVSDREKATGITFAVLSIFIGLLTFRGHVHRRHRLSIGSELIVDTVRGIPCWSSCSESACRWLTR